MSGDGLEHEWLYDGRGEKAYKDGRLSPTDTIIYLESVITKLKDNLTNLEDYHWRKHDNR